MSLTSGDIAHVLLALVLVLVSTQLVGRLFGMFHQPVVVGEVLGGVLLGPTLISNFAPKIFSGHGASASILGAVSELGLLLLMFLSGAEVAKSQGAAGRSVLGITLVGLVIPLSLGLLALNVIDTRDLLGPAASSVSFGLVFGISIAVTSIPVISRIMLDLDIIGTNFAKKVLGVAVFEDVILYVVLAVATGLAQARTHAQYGLAAVWGISSVEWSSVYYILVSLGFFATALRCGPRILGWLVRSRGNIIERHRPIAFRLMVLMLAALCCVALSINPIFGGLIAGLLMARADNWDSPSTKQAWAVIQGFSMAFFISIYFGVVGLQLDLLRTLDIPFFLGFLLFASAVKFGSVWLGARIAGEPQRRAIDLAAALNCRGGPGIVLATVALDAGIISTQFFTSLVLLAIVTSQASGYWLHRVRDRLRDDVHTGHYRRPRGSSRPLPHQLNQFEQRTKGRRGGREVSRSGCRRQAGPGGRGEGTGRRRRARAREGQVR